MSKFTRRKQITIGTTAKVRPERAFARRASLICKKLGGASAYYFWLVDRIMNGESTKFRIGTAMEELGAGRRSIDRWNDKLVKLGFMTIRNRLYRGQYTYSEYILLEINEVIQDDGLTHAKNSPMKVQGRNVTSNHKSPKPPQPCATNGARPCATNDATKTAGLERSGGPLLSPTTTKVDAKHLLSVEDRTEAVPREEPLPRLFYNLSDSDGWDEVIESIIEDAPPCGFKKQTIADVVSDARRQTHVTPEVFKHMWETYLSPAMHEDTFWTHHSKKRLGMGWLFIGYNLEKMLEIVESRTKQSYRPDYKMPNVGDEIHIKEYIAEYGVKPGVYEVEHVQGHTVLFGGKYHAPIEVLLNVQG